MFDNDSADLEQKCREEVSELTRLTNKLKLSEEKYRNIVNTAMEGILQVDPYGKTAFANTRMADMLGYSLEELKEMPFFNLLDPGNSKDTLTRNHAFYDSSLDFKFRRKDGSFLNAIISQSPVYNDQAACIGLLFMVTDITKRKMMEDQLREHEQMLQQKNIALKEMIAQVNLEKQRTEDNILQNIEKLLLPTITRLKEENTGIDPAVLTLLENNIQTLTSPFASALTQQEKPLSNREWEICNMIRNGLSTKEISRLLCISGKSVENHRNTVRKKLGISRKNVNLKTFLSDLQ